MRILDYIRRLPRPQLYNAQTRGTYERLTMGTYELGKTLLVPAGQSVYDPDVFDRYDPSTQRVVSLDDDGLWTKGVSA